MKSKKDSYRRLCWDASLMRENKGVSVVAHKPVKRNVAFHSTAEWEGVHNGYASVLRVGNVVRMYYRADSTHFYGGAVMTPGKSVICVAESHDGGLTFKRPYIGRYEYNGTKGNNIVYAREGSIDNFSVFYDKNPACPNNARFKALSEWMDENRCRHLCCYVSEDGYDFRRIEDIPVVGTFDSYNVILWDDERELYFVYYRSYHRANGDEIGGNFMTTDLTNDIRDIRVATSPDFKSWTDHGRITFKEGQKDFGLYTNHIQKYDRANVFIGFPQRYIDRRADVGNFEEMLLGDRHAWLASLNSRDGTALTDSVIMTSNDGFLFDRRDEAFMTPGAEARDNWWYGTNFLAYGMIETEAEEEWAANEISLYAVEGYRINHVNLRRYTMRLDGFFSFYAPYAGGEFLTEPVEVTGDELYANFASSALGGLKIVLCDEKGTPIEGYESGMTFGDSVDRRVHFGKSLAPLRGKRVTLRIALYDTHLYSFVFA